jgi:hypothetical protein
MHSLQAPEDVLDGDMSGGRTYMTNITTAKSALEYHTLEYSTTTREVYREYKSDPDICRRMSMTRGALHTLKGLRKDRTASYLEVLRDELGRGRKIHSGACGAL